MTPKEKAQELIERFIQGTRNKQDRFSISYIRAKQCALIAVDEIMKIEYWVFMEMGGGQEENYWQQVKNEIEKL